MIRRKAGLHQKHGEIVNFGSQSLVEWKAIRDLQVVVLLKKYLSFKSKRLRMGASSSVGTNRKAHGLWNYS